MMLWLFRGQFASHQKTDTTLHHSFGGGRRETLDIACSGWQREFKVNWLEAEMLLRRVVIPGCLLAIGSATVAAAQAPAAAKSGYSVSGVIRGTGDDPIPDAQISLSREGRAATLFRTGPGGRYGFASVAPGRVRLSVRRLGYRAATLAIDVGPTMDSAPFDFHLEETPSDVADVIVEGAKGHLDEFYNHRANNNFAKFFDGKEIEKHHPTFLSELLRTVPGASLYASERTGNRVMLRDCKPMVWLDGMRAQGAELDEVVAPMDVAGLEVYPSSAGLPPQYQDRNNRMCGAIVVWTKNQ